MNYRLLVETCWPTWVNTLVERCTPAAAHSVRNIPRVFQNFIHHMISSPIRCVSTLQVYFIRRLWSFFQWHTLNMQIKEETVICSGVLCSWWACLRGTEEHRLLFLSTFQSWPQLMSRTHNVCFQVFTQWLSSANLLIDLFSLID